MVALLHVVFSVSFLIWRKRLRFQMFSNKKLRRNIGDRNELVWRVLLCLIKGGELAFS